MSTVVWHGEKAKAAAREACADALLVAAQIVAEQMRANIGTEGGGVIGSDLNPRWMQGPPSPFKKRRRKKAKYFSSPPGSFPGWRTGHLARSMTAQPGQGLSARAGSSVKYGYWLEYGTTKMPARPWAMRSYYMAKPRAAARFSKDFARGFNARMREGT